MTPETETRRAYVPTGRPVVWFAGTGLLVGVALLATAWLGAVAPRLDVGVESASNRGDEVVLEFEITNDAPLDAELVGLRGGGIAEVVHLAGPNGSDGSDEAISLPAGETVRVEATVTVACRFDGPVGGFELVVRGPAGWDRGVRTDRPALTRGCPPFQGGPPG